LAKAIFKLPILLNSNSRSGPPADFDYLEQIKSLSKKLLHLIKNYYLEENKQSQMIFLDSLTEFVLKEKPLVNAKDEQISFVNAIYVKMLHYFFNELGFLNETFILEWYEKQLKSESSKDALKSQALAKLKPFIEWLKEEDDEDEDDDDDE
jgi:hypothetical protein